MSEICFVCGEQINENNVRVFMTHVKCENAVIPISKIIARIKEEKPDIVFPTTSCFVCRKDILPNHVREIVQKHVNCHLSKEQKEKPKE